MVAMSKQTIASLIRNPDNDHISKIKVFAAIFLFVVIGGTVIIGITQLNKKKYLAQQKEQQQQKRSQASNVPMYANGGGEDTRQYLERQTKLKNLVRNPIPANTNDLLVMNDSQNVPPIIGADGKPISTVTPKPTLTIPQDPITQEYQTQKLESLKHKYAAYRADTLLGPQGASQPGSATSPPTESGNIPQPVKTASNAEPSNGYITPVNASSSVPSTDNANYAGQNAQSDKTKFMVSTAKSTFNDDYINTTVVDPISRYEVKAGTPIPAFMITPINSDLPGIVTAQIARNIYDTKTGNYLLIPGGSKLVGVYDSNISYGQSRVMVAWNRVIFPSGASYRLYGMPGTDSMGTSGVTGEVNNHYGRIYGSAMVMGVITAGMQYSQNNSNPNAQSGSAYVSPTVSQSLAAGLGQQLGQAGLQVTQKNLNVQPTIEIPASQQINIMLTADIVLKPLNQKTYMGNALPNRGRG